MKVKNIRHLMLGIICLVLAVICLAVGAAGGSAPKYLISAVLLLALGRCELSRRAEGRGRSRSYCAGQTSGTGW